LTAPWSGPPPGSAAPPSIGKGRALAISLSAACMALVVALSVLFFTGVLRIGAVRLSGVKTAAKVDSRYRPVEATDEFSGKERRIYCCCRIKAFEDTVLEVRWYLGGAQVGGYAGTFGAIARKATGRSLPARGDVAFYLDRPSDGWLGGDYRVAIYADGRRKAEETFSIGQLERGSGLVTYEDPEGSFSVGVPYSWTAADSETVDEALAGFTAQGNGYPPRFVVVETGYESADPNYLNGVLAPGGGTPASQFQAYSLGETAAARRDFEWDYRSGESTLKLHTVQVVAQGPEGDVLGLNCHSLAADYEANLPVFNAIINSFKL
jgi:hypothetical protein